MHTRTATALLTGISSGLGYGLAAELLGRGWEVYGCSRRPGHPQGAVHRRIDITDYASLPAELDRLTAAATQLDLVVLNAGILGGIRDLCDTPMEEAKRVMETNLWANKAIMDWLCRSGRSVAQIVMISSGASVLGNRGWSGYSLSKAALNMLARLYSHEFPDTHICALAPGIVDTAMMGYLCGEEADAARYPALQRLRDARGTAAMPTPALTARQVVEVLPRLRERPSGDFIDIRELLDPERYASLYKK